MAVSFASQFLLLAQSTPTEELAPYWPWAAVLLTGAAAGFISVWLGTQSTRRAAREQAEELVAVARRDRPRRGGTAFRRATARAGADHG